MTTTLEDRPRLQARPTIYKGIRMRSRLEAQRAALFDELGWQWTYEPVCFADESGQYLPDFLVKMSPDHPDFYIEVKPYLDERQLSHWQRRMEIIWSSEPDAPLGILCPEGLYATHEARWQFFPEAPAEEPY